MFVHRPERYMKNFDREDLKGLAEFIVAKQRAGPTGMGKMVFLKEWQRFDCHADGFMEE
jgi:replicative DNA helicase